MASKKRDPMLGMSLRERTQEKARQARMEAAARRKAAAEQTRKDKEAEAARKAAPANERARAQSESGGMGTPTKPKPKPQPAQPAAPKPKPKPKPKPQPVQPAASKPKPKPKPEQPAAPAKGKSIVERGGPNFKDYPNSVEGVAAYDKAVANWKKTQESSKRPVRRPGESNASFNRRMQAYQRKNRK